MGSLSPSDSASNDVESVRQQMSSLQSPGELAVVLEKLASMSLPPFVVQSVVKNWSGAYHAYLRKSAECVKNLEVGLVSPGTSSVSGTSASSSSGSFRGRGRFAGVSASPASSALSSLSSRCSGVSRFSPSTLGYCYLSAVPIAERQGIAAAIGPNPSLERLAALPEGSLATEEKLRELYVVGAGDKYHLQVVPGNGSQSLFQVLSTLREQTRVGFTHCERGDRTAPDLFTFILSRLGIVEESSSVVGLQELRAFSVLVGKVAAMHDADGRRQLRVFEAAGEAVFSHVLARESVSRGTTVQEYQERRSAMLSSEVMAEVFLRSFPAGLFSCPAGFSFGGSAAAKTFEAVVGAIDCSLGFSAASRFLASVGVGCDRVLRTAVLGLDNPEAWFSRNFRARLQRFRDGEAEPRLLPLSGVQGCKTLVAGSAAERIIVVYSGTGDQIELGWMPVGSGDLHKIMQNLVGENGVVLMRPVQPSPTYSQALPWTTPYKTWNPVTIIRTVVSGFKRAGQVVNVERSLLSTGLLEPGSEQVARMCEKFNGHK